MSARFGGKWTSEKLDVLQKYLSAYSILLQNKPNPERPFKKAYIDAFAGCGYIEERREALGEKSPCQGLDLEISDRRSLLSGSARIALQVNPRFDKYIFVEKNPRRCEELKNLKCEAEFRSLSDCIDVHQGDANSKIQELCNKDWSSHRAVLFLDPYGMQVEWKTIEAVARTNAIDLWFLFPLGMAVNRLLTKSGEIPESWQAALDRIFGTTDWRDELYSTRIDQSFFGDTQLIVKEPVDAIVRYLNNRLKSVFVGVVDEPGILRNSTNNPLYLLCFAVGNKNGKRTALRIANDLIGALR